MSRDFFSESVTKKKKVDDKEKQEPIEFPEMDIEIDSWIPIANYGIKKSKNLVDEVRENYSNVWINNLRYYFDVNNEYVINKIKILMYPFANKSWLRKQNKESEALAYLPPSKDVNAPDLYVPTMAFITYVFLVSFIYTLEGYLFDPSRVIATAYKGFLILGLEVAIIKFLFYLLLPPDSLPWLDVISYCGYKFVGVSVMLLIATISRFFFYVAFLLFFVFMAIFMIKTLRVILRNSLDDTHLRNTRNYIIISIAIFQGVLTLVLCYLL